MQLVGGEVEHLIDVGHGEVARGDAVIAGENAVEDEPRAFREALAHGGPLHDVPARGLRVGGGRNGGGEGVEKHVSGGRRRVGGAAGDARG